MPQAVTAMPPAVAAFHADIVARELASARRAHGRIRARNTRAELAPLRAAFRRARRDHEDRRPGALGRLELHHVGAVLAAWSRADGSSRAAARTLLKPYL